MPTAEITVEFCNPQQPGKKNASVKTKDGKLYFVPPEMFSQFTVGGSYSIEYKDSSFTGRDGKRVPFNVVEKVNASMAAPATGRNHQPAGRYQDDPAVAERIFVCGAINNMMSNQNIDPRGMTVEDVTEQVNKLREVWRRTFANPQQDQEMGDEIPF